MAFVQPGGPRRILLVGWDGACWEVLDRLLSEGRLPHLARLVAAGFRSPLRSTIPPVTAPSWTAMATGLGPGRSGVLGFRHFDLSRTSGFSPKLTSSHDLRGLTLFEHLAEQGESLAVVGWPMTWPPLPLRGGVLLAGWPRPRSSRPATWPRSLGRSLGPWADGDPRPRFASASVEAEIASAAWWDRRHSEIACRFLRERDDGFVAVVFSGTDHLSHLLWGDPRLDEHFERVDLHLGSLLAAAGPQTACLLVSDHGFGPAPREEFHLGRWLEAEGWLTLKPESETGNSSLGRRLAAVRHGLPPQAWRIVRDRLPGPLRTWGYERALGVGRIDRRQTRATRLALYEHWEGICLWSASDEEMAQLIDGLVRRPEVRRVLTAEEAFPGARQGAVPDLVVELHPKFRGGDGLGDGPLVSRVEDSVVRETRGSHREFGVLVGAGPGLRPGSPPRAPRVEDVGMTALALAGVPLPGDRDGRVWTESIDLVPRYLATSPAPPSSAPTQRERTAEYRKLESELRRFGYSG